MFDLGNIFGIDITGDGKTDLIDDLLMIDILEEEDEDDNDDDED